MIQYIKSHLLIDFHHNFRITFKLERKYTFLKIKYEPHVSEPNIHFVEHYLHLCAFKYLMKHPSMFAKLKCHSIGSIVYSLVLFFFSWRLITLQYCSGFCHTLTWITHGFTCVPHPNPPSRLPPHTIPLGLPSAPALSTCLMHPTWTCELFHPW